LQVRRAVKLEKIKRWDTSAVNFSYMQKLPVLAHFWQNHTFLKLRIS
jgi:hypothetical protein